MATALIAAGVGLVGSVGSALIAKSAASKAAKSAPLAMPRQAQLRSSSAVSDALLSRRGSRANQRTGPRGAEAPMGTKTKLGQ